MQKISTKQLVLCAILATISGFLSGPLSFYFMTWKISFATIPVIIAGILCGPILGGMTGFVADVINVSLAPRGGYNPLFSLTFALIGVIAGFIYRRKDELSLALIKTTVTVILCQILCSFILNTAIMVIVYGASPALFITKLTYNLVMIPINISIIQLILNPKIISKTAFLYR